MSGLVCVTGSKGSPGATTLALALALTTAADRGSVVLVDADCDGGDLAPLLGLPSSPGVVSLAAATRHGFSSVEIGRHLQAVSPRVDLLAAPPDAEQSTAALASLDRGFAGALAGLTAVVDLGRWRPTSPNGELVSAASATVLVVHPSVAGVAHARTVFDDLAGRCGQVVVVTRGERPYGPDDVALAIGCSDVVVVPVDRAGALMLTAGVAERWLRRSSLARTASSLGTRLWPTQSAAPTSTVAATVEAST